MTAPFILKILLIEEVLTPTYAVFRTHSEIPGNIVSSTNGESYWDCLRKNAKKRKCITLNFVLNLSMQSRKEKNWIQFQNDEWWRWHQHETQSTMWLCKCGHVFWSNSAIMLSVFCCVHTSWSHFSSAVLSGTQHEAIFIYAYFMPVCLS